MAKQIPSKRTLEGVPARVLTFLMGVGSPKVRIALASRGYNQQEHDYALQRLSKLTQLRSVPDADAGVEVKTAIVELDAWDEPNMAAIRATLKRLYPEQEEFVFDNLEPSQGLAAVIGVQILLDRLDALQTGVGRDYSQREVDQAAIATLATRGYTELERKRLRNLVNVAQTVAPVPEVAPAPEDDRERILVELYDWLYEWSFQAKLVVTNRLDLIRLGLAKRRRARGVEPDEDPDESIVEDDRPDFS